MDLIERQQRLCRVQLCNRKSVEASNLCDGHYRQIIDKALSRKKTGEDITESELRALWGDR